MTQPISILIADDHPIVRQGVKQLLVKAFPGVVIGEAQDAAGAIEKVCTRDWDLALLDLGLPDRSGLDCLEDLKRLRPTLPVLILSMYAEDQFAARALKAGAAGYLPKQRAAEEILQAVKKLLAGGTYLSPEYAEQLAFASMRGDDRPPHERLTQREFRIMCIIASGKAVSQIARELSRSVKTISSHRTRILEKMNMKTNAELTHYCVRHGLID
jgi:DNA-binding NarL/FixJ family response regulator